MVGRVARNGACHVITITMKQELFSFRKLSVSLCSPSCHVHTPPTMDSHGSVFGHGQVCQAFNYRIIFLVQCCLLKSPSVLFIDRAVKLHSVMPVLS